MRTSSRADRAIDAVLWAAGLLFAGITLVYSLVPTPPQDAFAIGDKWLHTASYFATSLCLLLAAVWRPGRGDGPFPGWSPPGAVALVVAGAAIEVAQGLFTSRDAGLADVVADLVGVGAALLVHALLKKMAADRAA